MYPDDEHLLVVRPVEDADLAPAGQGALAAPQEVVVQLFRGGLLEACTVTACGLTPLITCLCRLAEMAAAAPAPREPGETRAVRWPQVSAWSGPAGQGCGA
jgi:hypothetical protein